MFKKEFFIPLLGVFVLDQTSKWFVLLDVANTLRVIEVNAFLNIVVILNRGIGFGILYNALPYNSLVLSFSAAVIVIGLLIWTMYIHSILVRLSFGLIIGGAISNITDRLHYNGVIDFIDCHFGTLHWPSFNFADSAITLGAISAIIGLRYEEKL